MNSFIAKIYIIGVNPYVKVPKTILDELFQQSGKSKGPIPVKGFLNGKPFVQTLVKYAGVWRLYLNTPMRKAAGIDVGDTADVKIAFDSRPRVIPMHPKLKAALAKNKKAAAAFNRLSPSRQKEITRYIHSLKTEESLQRNIIKVISHLKGNAVFAGRNL